MLELSSPSALRVAIVEDGSTAGGTARRRLDAFITTKLSRK